MLSRRVSLLGVGFDPLRSATLVGRVADALDEGKGGWIVTANLDILRQSVEHPERRALLEAATFVVADGVPIVWASRLQGTPVPERVAGSDLMWALPEMAAERGHSLYLLGGDPGVVERAAARLRERWPDLRIVGMHSPAHGFDSDPGQVQDVLHRVVDARPEIVLVALGFPKQEHLIVELRRLLPNAWMVGVGISFSFAAGDIRRAPRALQVVGLEWLHRFAQEPRRLARRYLLHGLPFAARLLVAAASEWVRRGSRFSDRAGR